MTWTNLVLDNGVRVAGVISGADTAQEAFALFAASAAGAAFMSDPNSRSIGVSEYAGLWIIVTSNAALQNDAVVDANLVVAHQFGTDSAEVMFAGTGPGNARLGAGADAYFGGRFNDTVRGDAGDDQLFGRAGNDVLNGGLGNDTITGGAGNDLLTGGSGNDRIDGGDGIDRAYFTGTLAATVNLALTTAQITGHGTDTILNVEHLSSGSGNDRLTGNALGNSLLSGDGNDTLNGAAGNDALYGGAGNDLLTGGTGLDTFVFNATLGSGNVDRIADFSVIDDTIRLDDAFFNGLTTGNLAASAFAANLTGVATDGLDRLIYETDTGRLYFDADGNGAGARVHFATLNASLAITNADFFVF